MMAAAFSDIRPIDEPLIRYRTHGSQQVGFENKYVRRAQSRTPAGKHWQRLAESADELQQLCDALLAKHPDHLRAALPAYQQHLAFIRFRQGLPARRLARLGLVIAHHSQYEIHASGLRSMLKDIVTSRQPSPASP